MSTREITKTSLKESQLVLARRLNQLGDDYTLAGFQKEVYRRTGLVAKPDESEAILTLHKPVSIKLAEQPRLKKGMYTEQYWGFTGIYVSKPLGALKMNGHYTAELMDETIRLVDNGGLRGDAPK